MYTGILSGFLYDPFISMSRKLTILRLICIAMFKPHSLNSFIIAFLFLSISGLDKFLTTAKLSSLYKPTRSLSRILPSIFNIYDPTISQTYIDIHLLFFYAVTFRGKNSRWTLEISDRINKIADKLC